MGDFHVRCDCGEIEYSISETGIRSGNRLVCYCRSCRVSDIHLRGNKNGLTPDFAVEIIQISPHALRIKKGQSLIRAYQLNSKGSLRWYAECCGTPLWNTLKTPRFPFLGVVIPPAHHTPKSPELGETRYVNTKNALPQSQAPKKDNGFGWAVRGILRRAPAAIIHSKQNPLKKENGGYIVDFTSLSNEQRANAYQRAQAVFSVD